MKKLALILMLVASPVYAEMTINQSQSYCLKQQNYSQANFNTFDFQAAARCVHKYVALKIDREEAATSSFLEQNPHYKGDGSGWYKSVEVYSTR